MNYKNYVIGTLSQDAFVMVNKNLARKIGFVEAGLLAELIFTHKYAEQQKWFFEDGSKGDWFYLTQAKVQEELGIKRTEHENAIKKLVKFGIILKKKMGLPSKNYYLINWKVIVDIVDSVDNSGETPPEPAPQTDCRKPANKSGGNLRTRVEETCELDSRKPTSIHINKNDLEKESIKPIYKKIVNKEGEFIGKEELVNIGNDFYSEFAAGRYSKKQWSTIIDKLTTEIVEREVKLRDGRAYMLACLEGIAHKHDLKNGKVEFEFERKRNGPFYNWLDTIDEEQEDEMPW
jgi:DNA-binding Lrp family transcriptional regulator